MSETNQPMSNPPAANRGAIWLPVALGIGLLAASGMAVYEHQNLVNMRLEMSALHGEMATMRQTVATADDNMQQTLGILRQELDTTRKETAERTQQVSSAARRQAEILASRLTKAQAQRNEQLDQQLSELRTMDEQAATKLSEMTSTVGTVSTKVESTRTDLDKTIADLHRTTGDLGVMSGRIATNAKELAALRELGERDYIEFTLSKKAKQQRVGDVTLNYKKADPKRSKYSLELMVDDKTVEKKDRTINEPVQFYVLSKARQPYEIVVNDVRKDQIVGYLSVPKVKTVAQR